MTPRSPGLRGFVRKLIKTLIPKKYIETWKIGSFRQSGEVHQWMYDQYSLGALLTHIGCTDVEKQTAATSKLPGFAAFELDARANGVVFKPDSLFMEAVKPAL